MLRFIYCHLSADRISVMTSMKKFHILQASFDNLIIYFNGYRLYIKLKLNSMMIDFHVVLVPVSTIIISSTINDAWGMV